MTQACIKCGDDGQRNTTTPQTFKDGTVHLRIDCGSCGKFLAYKKQDRKTYRDEMFRLVMELSIASPGEFLSLTTKAKDLMRRTNKE